MRKIVPIADLFCGAGGTSQGAVEAIEALGFRAAALSQNSDVSWLSDDEPETAAA